MRLLKTAHEIVRWKHFATAFAFNMQLLPCVAVVMVWSMEYVQIAGNDTEQCIGVCTSEVMKQMEEKCSLWRERLPRPDLFSTCQNGYSSGTFWLYLSFYPIMHWYAVKEVKLDVGIIVPVPLTTRSCGRRVSNIVAISAINFQRISLLPAAADSLRLQRAHIHSQWPTLLSTMMRTVR